MGQRAEDRKCEEEERTWWVWRDALLEEWFYTDVDIRKTPGLHKQLLREKTVIHEVRAHSGVGAIEKIIPGYREQRGHKAGLMSKNKSVH